MIVFLTVAPHRDCSRRGHLVHHRTGSRHHQRQSPNPGPDLAQSLPSPEPQPSRRTAADIVEGCLLGRVSRPRVEEVLVQGSFVAAKVRGPELQYDRSAVGRAGLTEDYASHMRDV